MNIVFTMCFTGSFLFILYLMISFFFKRLLNSAWNYAILKFVLFLFIIPLGLLKSFFYQVMPSINFRLEGHLPFAIATPHGIYSNTIYKANTVVVFLWLGMTLAILIWQQSRYARLKKSITKTMAEITNPELLYRIDKFRQTIGIKRKIRFYQSDYICPFTTGIFFPIVVLPVHLTIAKQELIAKHELIHVKRFDIFFLLLRRLVTCFYWFNPLVYILDVHLERMVEISCDRVTLLDMGQKDRNDYANLIIDMSAYDVQYQSTYVSSFSRNMIYLKERMEFIMIPEKKKKYRNMCSVLLTSSMVICSSFTAFAYQPPMKFSMSWESSYNVLSDFGLSDYITFKNDSNFTPQIVGSILFEEQFTDSQGNIYKINPNSDTPYAACTHNYVDGTYSKHVKKGKGCVTKYYDAQRCSKCGHIAVGSLIDTETHDVCLHK